MGTQGLLTVMKNNEVVAKIICGCNGGNIKAIEFLIKIEHTVDIGILYKMAENVGFGCRACLVVMDKDRVLFKGDEDEFGTLVGGLYRRTFDLPNFNPRWKEGMSDYMERVKI